MHRVSDPKSRPAFIHWNKSMSAEKTAQALAAITDEGVFEHLATAILREANQTYRSLVHTGAIVTGKTGKSPIDGICFVQGADPPHMIAVHHTTTARAVGEEVATRPLQSETSQRLEAYSPRRRPRQDSGTDSRRPDTNAEFACDAGSHDQRGTGRSSGPRRRGGGARSRDGDRSLVTLQAEPFPRQPPHGTVAPPLVSEHRAGTTFDRVASRAFQEELRELLPTGQSDRLDPTPLDATLTTSLRRGVTFLVAGPAWGIGRLLSDTRGARGRGWVRDCLTPRGGRLGSDPRTGRHGDAAPAPFILGSSRVRRF